MNKNELMFNNILNVLDKDLAEYLMEFDFKLLEMEGITKLNSFQFKKDYWSKPTEEITVNANANVGNTGMSRKTFCNLTAEMVSPINKLSAIYLFRKYGNRIDSKGDDIVRDIILGKIYYHNSSLPDLPYCIGLSTYPLLTEGLTFGSLSSSPPKRPTSFTNQVIRFVQIASNHFAGATALTDFIQNYSYFTLQKPDYTDKEKENDFQNLVHGISDEIRYATQSPFVNISISSPETMRYTMANYVWGDLKISDLMEEIMKNQLLFSKFMSRGQLNKGQPIGLPYRFPITTLVADPSFEKEYPAIWKEILEDNANLCYLNIFNNMQTDLKSLSMCCRLSIDVSKLLGLSINNTFGSFLQIGSHGVCSINLPRIAYETKDEATFLEILKERMQTCRLLLKIHREEILQKRRIKFHYFFNHGYLNLKRNFFSTVGFIGLANALEILGIKITEPSGLAFAKKILETMRAETSKYTDEDGYMYNIEEVPAESASGTLAQKDKLLVNGTYDYYDSQFVPLSYDIDLFDRVEIEGELQQLCTGGSISHLNVDGRPDKGALYELTQILLKKTNLRHFAFNAGFTICSKGHNSLGVFRKCPQCFNEEVDWATRVVGYFTPISQWNRLKQKEFQTRKWNNICRNEKPL